MNEKGDRERKKREKRYRLRERAKESGISVTRRRSSKMQKIALVFGDICTFEKFCLSKTKTVVLTIDQVVILLLK